MPNLEILRAPHLQRGVDGTDLSAVRWYTDYPLSLEDFVDS